MTAKEHRTQTKRTRDHGGVLTTGRRYQLQSRAGTGVHAVATFTSRTYTYARPADATLPRRVAAPLLLIPVFLLSLVLAAALVVAILIVGLLVAVSVVLGALFARGLRRRY
jgi:hypothetical protein